MTSFWLPEHAAAAARDGGGEAPLIIAADTRRIAPGLDLWDFWPLERDDGMPAEIEGGTLWFALGAQSSRDVHARHAVARIHLFHRAGGAWRHLGAALPAGLGPGSREWSGSAVLDDATGRVRLFFTAAGLRGEARPSFAQRLFTTTGMLRPGPAIAGWSDPREIVASDGDVYVLPGGYGGGPGTIKAFRDPAWFRDPADGRGYVLFAASLGRTPDPANGAVGIARLEDGASGAWSLLAPLIGAEGVSNELERPHVRIFDNRYCLFWSTRRQVFAAGGPAGPTGLYGMVADRLFGPWRPLNGSGLILANPEAAPEQAYGWWVLADGRITGSIEHLAADPDQSRFGSGPAPELRLSVAGDRTRLSAAALS